MRHDVLADAMSVLKNAENVGKKECNIRPASKLIGEMLNIINEQGYIAGFEKVEDGKGGRFNVKLKGRINNCNVIKPRPSVSKDGYTRFEKRFLPALDFGTLIVSTPGGMKAHGEVKNKSGGVLLAYIF